MVASCRTFAAYLLFTQYLAFENENAPYCPGCVGQVSKKKGNVFITKKLKVSKKLFEGHCMVIGERPEPVSLDFFQICSFHGKLTDLNPIRCGFGWKL